MHERFIEWVNGHEGVEWRTFGEMVQEFKGREMEGWMVEGGVDDCSKGKGEGEEHVSSEKDRNRGILAPR